MTYGYFTRMISVRAHEISNRSLSTMSEMRKMADDSKGTIISLLLELLRIDITNEHIKIVIDYLGQAVRISLPRSVSASTFGEYPTPSGTTASCCPRRS